MKTSKEALERYQQINTIWKENGFPIRFSSNEKNEKVDFEIAKRVVRTFWKREMGQNLPYKIREGSGNRRNSVRRGILTINTDSGWSNIVHDIGHTIDFRKYPDLRPHSSQHATLEYRFTKLVFDGGYIEKSRQALANKPKKQTLNPVHKNYNQLKSRQENLLNKQKQYESNLKRVANSLKKVEKSIAQYEKKYDEEKLTSKYKEPVKRKPVKSYKQKCEELLTKHEWLRIERNEEWWEGEMRLDVYDQNDLELNEDYFEEGSGGEYCTWTWKQAYDLALVLIDRRS